MHLEGSCHCGSVKFSVESHEPVPFMRCYCSICRKTAGTGGYAINLGADHRTLKVTGKRYLRIYQATIHEDGGVRHSTGQRHFCSRCGTALWMYSPDWPDLMHPHAGAIDTPLPPAPHSLHILLGSKANWVPVQANPGDVQFDRYPNTSLAEWHAQQGLASPTTAPQNTKKKNR